MLIFISISYENLSRLPWETARKMFIWHRSIWETLFQELQNQGRTKDAWISFWFLPILKQDKWWKNIDKNSNRCFEEYKFLCVGPEIKYHDFHLGGNLKINWTCVQHFLAGESSIMPCKRRQSVNVKVRAKSEF